MSRAIILGSGTSNGVPMLGVEYPDAFLANPKNWRTRSSLLLQGPTGNFLVDCAPEMRLQLLSAKCMNLDAVLITHTHADHIMGMDDLRSFSVMARKAHSSFGRKELGMEGIAMPIYTLPRYQEDIRRVFAYAFMKHPAGIETPQFQLLDVPETIEAGGMLIQTLIVDHGPMPVVAIRVNDFAYVTDVSHIPEPAWAMLQNLDTLILDAVRYKPHPNHFHFDAAIETAQGLGAKTTYFTHLSHDYDHDEVDASLPPGIRLAWDGLETEI